MREKNRRNRTNLVNKAKQLIERDHLLNYCADTKTKPFRFYTTEVGCTMISQNYLYAVEVDWTPTNETS